MTPSQNPNNLLSSLFLEVGEEAPFFNESSSFRLGTANARLNWAFCLFQFLCRWILFPSKGKSAWEGPNSSCAKASTPITLHLRKPTLQGRGHRCTCWADGVPGVSAHPVTWEVLRPPPFPSPSPIHQALPKSPNLTNILNKALPMLTKKIILEDEQNKSFSRQYC